MLSLVRVGKMLGILDLSIEMEPIVTFIVCFGTHTVDYKIGQCLAKTIFVVLRLELHLVECRGMRLVYAYRKPVCRKIDC